MKPNPFFSGFVCGVALTLASIIVILTYNKNYAPTVPANPLIPETGAIQLAQAGGRALNLTPPTRGPVTAPVTIIDYSDFYCGFCKKVMPTLLQVTKNYPDKVKLVFKHHPLSQTPGQGSYFVHEAAVCAHEQAKFWEFFEAAFAYSGHPDPAAVRQIASQIGLNSQLFEGCLKTDRPKKVIEADLREAQSQKVDGTPTFFINGEVLAGAYPYETFQSKIESIINPRQAGTAPAAAAAAAPKAVPQIAPQPVQRAEFNDLKGRPSQGPEKAPITIVQFSDFHCPFCVRVEPTMDQIMKEYQGQVRKVWRHFPLSMHIGADRTHVASECANKQGKFWEYHDKLFKNFSAPKDDGLYISIAKEIGLKEKDFKKCLNDEGMLQQIRDDISAGSKVGVSGTPVAFINGLKLTGAQPFTSFKRVIDDELQKAKK